MASIAAAASSGGDSGSSGGQTQIGFEGVPIQSGSDIAPADTTQTGTVNKVDFTSQGPSLTIGTTPGIGLSAITAAS